MKDLISARITSVFALPLSFLLLTVPAMAVTFTEFPADYPGENIIAGPDHALWYTHNSHNFNPKPNDGVGRISISGNYTRVDVPGSTNDPWGISLSPNGDLWLTDILAAVIRRLSETGAWTEFPISNPSYSVTTAADGTIWFTEANMVGRLTSGGTLTEYPVPTESPLLGNITQGPDGNLWFTERKADKIGRITPAGTVTEFSLDSGSWPFSIVMGPDGNLWFTELFKNRIGRISIDGKLREFELPNPDSLPHYIVAGPDGNLWFTEMTGRIGRITPEGAITEFSVPTPRSSSPAGLTFGPDGNLWFVYQLVPKVTRMTLGGTAVNGPCVASDTILCIDDVPGDRRFQVEVEYQTVQAGGLSGKGKAVPLAGLGVARGGLFWFFSQDNPEIVIKVLNGCESNQKYWVFASGGTNVGMTITVSDTVTGEVHTYYNRDLAPFAPIQDVNALSCGD